MLEMSSHQARWQIRVNEFFMWAVSSLCWSVNIWPPESFEEQQSPEVEQEKHARTAGFATTELCVVQQGNVLSCVFCVIIEWSDILLLFQTFRISVFFSIRLKPDRLDLTQQCLTVTYCFPKPQADDLLPQINPAGGLDSAR